MTCKTVEEALSRWEEVSELYLKGDECRKACESDVEKLVNLKTLHYAPKAEDWSPFPWLLRGSLI
jgi:hypothetical protein